MEDSVMPRVKEEVWSDLVSNLWQKHFPSLLENLNEKKFSCRYGFQENEEVEVDKKDLTGAILKDAEERERSKYL